MMSCIGHVQVRKKRRMYRTGWFRLGRREGCIGQVQVREKRRMYRTG